MQGRTGMGNIRAERHHRRAQRLISHFEASRKKALGAVGLREPEREEGLGEAGLEEVG